MAARRIEVHHRRRLGHDAQHPRRERVTFQAQRTVKRKEATAARSAIIIAALDLDPAKPGEPGFFLPRLVKAHKLAATRAFRRWQSLVKLFEQNLQRRRAAAKRTVAEHPLHAVQVRSTRREVRRQLRKLRAELRLHSPVQSRKRPADRSGARQRQLALRDVAAPHLAAFKPVTGVSAPVLAQLHLRAFLPQAYQKRHRV